MEEEDSIEGYIYTVEVEGQEDLVYNKGMSNIQLTSADPLTIVKTDIIYVGIEWIIIYKLRGDNLPLSLRVRVPHADTLKKLRRWWRTSEHSNNKLIKGVKVEDE